MLFAGSGRTAGGALGPGRGSGKVGTVEDRGARSRGNDFTEIFY